METEEGQTGKGQTENDSRTTTFGKQTEDIETGQTNIPGEIYPDEASAEKGQDLTVSREAGNKQIKMSRLPPNALRKEFGQNPRDTKQPFDAVVTSETNENKSTGSGNTKKNEKPSDTSIKYIEEKSEFQKQEEKFKASVIKLREEIVNISRLKVHDNTIKVLSTKMKNDVTNENVNTFLRGLYAQRIVQEQVLIEVLPRLKEALTEETTLKKKIAEAEKESNNTGRYYQGKEAQYHGLSKENTIKKNNERIEFKITTLNFQRDIVVGEIIDLKRRIEAANNKISEQNEALLSEMAEFERLNLNNTEEEQQLSLSQELNLLAAVSQIYGDMPPENLLIPENKKIPRGFIKPLENRDVKAFKNEVIMFFRADNHTGLDRALEMRKLFTSPFIHIMFLNSYVELQNMPDGELKMEKIGDLNKNIETFQKYIEQSNKTVEFEFKRIQGALGHIRPDIFWGSNHGRNLFAKAVLQSGLATVIGMAFQWGASAAFVGILSNKCLNFSGDSRVLSEIDEAPSINGTINGTSTTEVPIEEVTSTTAATTAATTEELTSTTAAPTEDVTSKTTQIITEITTQIEEQQKITGNLLCESIEDFVEVNKDSLKKWDVDTLEFELIDHLRGHILDKLPGDNEEIKEVLLNQYNFQLEGLLDNLYKHEQQNRYVSSVVNTENMSEFEALGSEATMSFIKGIVAPLIDSLNEKMKQNRDNDQTEIIQEEFKTFIAKTRNYKCTSDFAENFVKQAAAGVISLGALAVFSAAFSGGHKSDIKELALNIFFVPLMNALIDTFRDRVNFEGEHAEIKSQLSKATARTFLARLPVLCLKLYLDKKVTITEEDLIKSGFLLGGGAGKETLGAIFQLLTKKDRMLASHMDYLALLEKDIFKMIEIKIFYLENKINETTKDVAYLNYLKFIKNRGKNLTEANKEEYRNRENSLQIQNPACHSFDNLDIYEDRGRIEFNKSSLVAPKMSLNPENSVTAEIMPSNLERTHEEGFNALTKPINRNRFGSFSSTNSGDPEKNERGVSISKNGNFNSEAASSSTDRAAPATKNAEKKIKV